MLFGVTDKLSCGDFAIHDADAGNVAHMPFRDWSLMAAVEAGCLFESSGTLRADAAGLEGVELGIAFVATPDWTDGRCGPAAGAGETLAPRNSLEIAQCARCFEAAPAVHSGVGSNQAGPYGLSPQSQSDEPGNSKETEGRRDQETARAAQRKPEEGAEDLATIEGIDGKNIKNQ